MGGMGTVGVDLLHNASRLQQAVPPGSAARTSKRCAVLAAPQGLWGLKGLNFKLPSWVGGKAAKK